MLKQGLLIFVGSQNVNVVQTSIPDSNKIPPPILMRLCLHKFRPRPDPDLFIEVVAETIPNFRYVYPTIRDLPPDLVSTVEMQGHFDFTRLFLFAWI